MLRIAGLTLIAVLAAGPSSAQCLTNQINGCWLAPSGSLSTNAPSYSGGGHCNPYGGDGSASYDLTVGQFSGYAHGPTDLDTSGRIRAQDEYQLIGPLGPDSLSIEAHFQVSGGVSAGRSYPFGCCRPASLSASISYGTRAQSASVGTTCCSGGSLSTTLVLPLRMLVNQPFVIQFDFWAHAYWDAVASGNATLTFLVPAGYNVVSCQGFSAGGIVGARGQSWGRLKVLYR